MFKLKSKLIVAVMLIMGVTAFVSCEKEKDEVLNTSTNNLVMKRAVDEPGVHRHFFDNGEDPGQEGVDYGCEEPALSCLDDMDVAVPALNHIFIDIINNHNEGSNVASNDIDIFKKNKDILSKIFSDKDIYNIINGTYTLDIRGSKKELSIKDRNYYKFMKNDKIQIVYPIKLK